jgi:hypothetical protein
MDNPEIGVCPNCKGSFPAGALFCRNCGWQPDQTSTGRNTSPSLRFTPLPLGPPPPSTGSAALGFVLGFIGTFVLAACAGAFFVTYGIHMTTTGSNTRVSEGPFAVGPFGGMLNGPCAGLIVGLLIGAVLPRKILSAKKGFFAGVITSALLMIAGIIGFYEVCSKL